MMKLSPARRLALLAGLLLLAAGVNWKLGGHQITVDFRFLGVVVVMAVLMLELKDKLLARDEIKVARQVQLALLPNPHPQLDGWSIWSHTRPANDVGGDLVDYLELEGGRLGIALGDVAGKGLGAALLMAKLQATLRAAAPDSPSLAGLGDRLNAILLRDGIDNRYATLFYLEIAPGSGAARCLNAGHNPPYALRATGIETLKAGSPPLGMLPEEEEFGVERLAELVRGLRGLCAEEAGTRLLGEIDRFLGDAPPYDDLSLVVAARSAG